MSLKIFFIMKAGNAGPVSVNGSASYIIGAVIALFILGYLIYTLLNPDKF